VSGHRRCRSYIWLEGAGRASLARAYRAVVFLGDAGARARLRRLRGQGEASVRGLAHEAVAQVKVPGLDQSRRSVAPGWAGSPSMNPGA